jgi:spore coat polysaccharide biosynthesis protein SpsF
MSVGCQGNNWICLESCEKMTKMRVVAIIQARMGSTRLPGKVMKDVGGETMLARVVWRARRAKLLDEVVVATTNKSADSPIVSECSKLGIPIFRGDEQDVLDRYYRSALANRAEAVVRITSDCPLVDPEIIDEVVHSFLKAKPDYASNTLNHSYPRGLDTEVMSMASLERAWHESNKPYHRSHVTPYIYQNPDAFRLLSVKGQVDHSSHRWTVDTREDLNFVRTIYGRFNNQDTFGWQDVLKLLDREPDLVEINHHVRQKAIEES